MKCQYNYFIAVTISQSAAPFLNGFQFPGSAWASADLLTDPAAEASGDDSRTGKQGSLSGPLRSLNGGKALAGQKP